MNAHETAAARSDALRAALMTETRIAEALAQRSRSLVDTVEALGRRALDEAADIADARRRFETLSRGLRDGLSAGEIARAGDLRDLAEATLAGFDFGAGPRIAIDGPAVSLGPEARQLVALTLFELASRSTRFGALADPLGRIALDWLDEPDGGVRVIWQEFGGRPETDRMQRGAGSALLELLSERFGAPLRLHVSPGFAVASLMLPACDVTSSGDMRPRSALIALGTVAARAAIAPLLRARGILHVTCVDGGAAVEEALGTDAFDLLVTDAATMGRGRPANACPPTIWVMAADAPTALRSGPVLQLPATEADLAGAIAAALRRSGSRRIPKS